MPHEKDKRGLYCLLLPGCSCLDCRCDGWSGGSYTATKRRFQTPAMAVLLFSSVEKAYLWVTYYEIRK